MERLCRVAWAAFAAVAGSLGAVAVSLLPVGPLPLPSAKPSPELLERGRSLAAVQCARCHRFPEPGLLDRGTWHGGVEPMMRLLLGLGSLDDGDPGSRELAADWRSIWEWYFHEAPLRLEGGGLPPIPLTLDRFDAVFFPYRQTNQMVSLVRVDAARHHLYVGNALSRTLDILDAGGRLLQSIAAPSPPVDWVEGREGAYVPFIWDLAPHTESLGAVMRLGRAGDLLAPGPLVLSGLPRPTSIAVGDLDDDGREDLAVSGFGHVQGALSWWRATANGFEERRLLERPGATRVAIADLNRDGRPDLVAQMAQAQEGLYWFENRGGGRFEQRVIEEFPPVWGGSGFQLADLDRDGAMDLLVTNGDAGEYRSPPRPYHGIRWYRNVGGSGVGALPRFEMAWHFPLPGAYGARVADFDADGDLDVAAISFFPDYERRREGAFVLLWNEGGVRFRPESLDAGMSGRWLVMDAGDLDGDGDVDIVLGAANRGAFDAPEALKRAWQSRGPAVLLLRNRLK